MTQDEQDAKAALAEQLGKLLGNNLPDLLKPATGDKEQKVVRDSFTMLETDMELIRHLQQRGLNMRMHIPKGELIRAGIHTLATLTDDQFLAAVNSVEKLKPGRKKKTPE